MSDTPQPSQPTAGSAKDSLLSTSLFICAALVAAQGAFAGMFLSGTGVGRALHLWTGFALPYLGFIPMFTVRSRVKDGRVSNRWGWVIFGFTLALWVQEALGHMPFPVTTAIHVPLGVCLFGVGLAGALEARRRGA